MDEYFNYLNQMINITNNPKHIQDLKILKTELEEETKNLNEISKNMLIKEVYMDKKSYDNFFGFDSDNFAKNSFESNEKKANDENKNFNNCENNLSSKIYHENLLKYNP